MAEVFDIFLLSILRCLVLEFSSCFCNKGNSFCLRSILRKLPMLTVLARSFCNIIKHELAGHMVLSASGPSLRLGAGVGRLGGQAYVKNYVTG